MDHRDDLEFVVGELARFRDRDVIVRRLCERGTYSWNEAEAFITWVEQEHKQQVTAARRPANVLLAGAVILGGLALTGSGAYLMAIGERVTIAIESLYACCIYTDLSVLFVIVGPALLVLGAIATWNGWRGNGVSGDVAREG